MASVCGFLPEYSEQEIVPEYLFQFLEFLVVNDDVVPSFLAEHALEEMKNKGHNPTLKETSQGHELSEENLKELGVFFNF